jgi:drug/metabolite transporter (DMT)-like permease
VKTAWKFGLVALAALAFVVLPGGGGALRVALSILTIAFFVAIALLASRLYREHRFELDSLSQSQRLILYSSIGLAFLTFTATNRLFDRGGAGVVVWLALLALCSYGAFWVWTRYRRYE